MKTCVECKLDKEDDEFHVSHHTEAKTYRAKKCKLCERGRPKGFAGKISEEEKKALAANKADYYDPDVSAATFHKKCGLKLGLQSFYRFDNLGQVAAFMETL